MNNFSEFGLIEQIKQLTENSSSIPKNLIKGIGDDCAVFQKDKKTYSLYTADISIEDIHFTQKMPAFAIGFRSMSANLSDIAAMGGKSELAIVSLAFPSKTSETFIKELYQGFLAAIKTAGANTYIAGGDISKSAKITINITVVGSCAKKNLCLRETTKANNFLWTTGITGLSKIGLEKILEPSFTRTNLKPEEINDPALLKHLYPVAKENFVKTILNKFKPTAMIDISDGLISELNHLCENSHLGYEIELGAFLKELKKIEKDFSDEQLLQYILTSGEEYELLFTSSYGSIGERLLINGLTFFCLGKTNKKNERKISYNQNNFQIKNINGFSHF